ISFINEVANLCDRVGADVNEVRRGIGHDRRIGFQFLFPGVGYGGSCFPKDVNALIRVAIDNGVEPTLLNAVDAVNDRQKEVLFAKLGKHFGGDFAGKTVAVWGLAFKPRTDDIREAPSLVLIDALLAAGAKVRAHDPVAAENVKAHYADDPAAAAGLSFCEHHYEAATGADALAICTEWNDYRHPDFDYLKHVLTTPAVFDGRNLYEPAKMAAAGFAYHGIGLDG
ncbi:MAG: nucleotide sugar dehydrogenase, partial [Planctomycetota bacterium]